MGNINIKNRKDCKFCKLTERDLLEMLPSKCKKKDPVACKRGIYKDEYCIATLAPEQYTPGTTILILKNHRTDITDSSLLEEELSGFINAIHKVAKHLKKNLKDNNNNSPERIYVCSLCDGIEHLHVHLIPRYQFSKEDIDNYRIYFETRDGKEEVDKKIEINEMGGFWYIAEREKTFKDKDLWRKTEDKERAKKLEELATKLRISLL